jgi:hypothetical protein
MDEKRLAIKYFMELTQQCKPGPGVCREAMDLSLSLAKHDPTMVQVCKDILRIVWDHTSPELYLRVTEQFVRETVRTSVDLTPPASNRLTCHPREQL